MVRIDTCVADLVSGFDKVVERGVAGSDVNQAESEILREKFRAAFSDNIRLGLATVFATNEQVTQQLPPQTEVTVDELMDQDEALLRMVGRRSKYPAKAAALLATTLKKNRVMLKGLNVKITKEKVDLSSVKDKNSDTIDKCFDKAMSDLKACKDLVVDNNDKASRLVDSYKMLKNAEEACLES